MSLPLANLVSLALSAVSLAIFVVALRRASRLMAMSRILAQQVASSAANLQQALVILQDARETCRDESVRLEARLKDSDRVRSEIARAIKLVEEAKAGLADNARSAPARNDEAPLPAPAQPPVVTRPVPVFVNRVVRSTDMASVRV